MRGKNVTIQHIAQEAGVSYQTVSRVINNHQYVAPETRERVLEVIARAGYRPNASARSLASKRTYALGLIVVDLSDYFYGQMITGVMAEARTHGYRCIVSSVDHDMQQVPEYVRLMAERHVDGLLVTRTGSEDDTQHLRTLLEDNVPIVAASFVLPDENLSIVDVDNVDGACQATQYLLSLGHRVVATITGSLMYRSARDRVQGYTHALQEAGLSAEPTLIVEGDWTYRSGYLAARLLLERGVAFTAIFSQNDQMAIGAMHALREAGRQVPDDVSIIGYDDIPGAAYAVPPLTTMRQPMRDVGAKATRLLIQAIERPETPREQIFLATERITRASCAEVRMSTSG